jgi:rhodanese-related sulfurtransferase
MRRGFSAMTLILLLVLTVFAVPAPAAEPQDSLNAFLSQLPQDFDTIAGKTLSAKLNSGENITVVDVREPDEFKVGHIDGAVNVPIRSLANNLSQLPKDKATPIAVVCKSGIRAAYGTMTLKTLGYTSVKDVVGGMLAWEKDGLPITK